MTPLPPAPAATVRPVPCLSARARPGLPREVPAWRGAAARDRGSRGGTRDRRQTPRRCGSQPQTPRRRGPAVPSGRARADPAAVPARPAAVASGTAQACLRHCPGRRRGLARASRSSPTQRPAAFTITVASCGGQGTPRRGRRSPAGSRTAREGKDVREPRAAASRGAWAPAPAVPGAAGQRSRRPSRWREPAAHTRPVTASLAYGRPLAAVPALLRRQAALCGLPRLARALAWLRGGTGERSRAIARHALRTCSGYRSTRPGTGSRSLRGADRTPGSRPRFPVPVSGPLRR